MPWAIPSSRQIASTARPASCDLIEKLYNIRKLQIEARKIIHTGSARVVELVSEEEGCYFRDTKVAFIKIAEEYTLEARESLVSHEDGEENCPRDPEKRCKRVTAPPAKYVESIYLEEGGGKWHGLVLIEMGWDFRLLDRPEDDEKD